MEENENQKEAEDTTPTVEHYGKTSHDATESVEQSDTAQDMAGQTAENEQQEVCFPLTYFCFDMS